MLCTLFLTGWILRSELFQYQLDYVSSTSVFHNTIKEEK